MQIWLVEDSAPRRMIDSAVVAGLVDAIGSQQPEALAKSILQAAATLVAVQQCMVFAHEAERTPRLLSAAGHQGPWQAFGAGAVLAREFSRQDGLRDVLERKPSAGPVGVVLVCRQSTTDFPPDSLRHDGLEAFDLIDRVSILLRSGDGDWLVAQLYRDASGGPFSPDDVDAIISLARLVARCLLRHYACNTDGQSRLRSQVTESMRDLGARLTAREREVLTRILDGVTVNRIAEDLHLRPTTVATYRLRAYEKLGVTSRHELFATVLQRRAMASHGLASDLRHSPAGLGDQLRPA